MAQQSGSCSITYKWTYDVFLSFHGEDTRLGFIGYLREALRQSGIHAFIDDEGIRTGEDITPALFKAIQESRVAIIVFSENYANSTFCLEELAKILECFKEEGRLIYPVFYYVDPSELRRPRGSYAEALARLEKRFKDNNDKKVEKWRLALSQTANFKGCHLKPKIAKEQECITKIISEVSTRINHVPLHVTHYPIGLVPRVKEMISLLELWFVEDTKMVGIWGTGGIGKSTIARALYNSIADHFEGLCFLFNIRKESRMPNGLAHLQETLLRKLVMEKDLKLDDFHEGMPIIKRRLSQKKILLILDDIDESVQLEALAGSCDWFGPGSRIVITTRNKQLLVSHTHVKSIYDVRKLNVEESLQLLSWHAFKKENVESDFIEVSNRAILYSCGFPLAIEVISSNLCGKGVDQWSFALDQFKAIPDERVLEAVQLSYDALGEFEKKVFLDLACFFNRKKLDDVKCMVLCLREIQPEYAIKVLIDKSLIKIEGDCVIMHDLIEDMGKEIVRRESQDEPGERSRLWFYRDILQVLQHDTGTNKVEAIFLDLPQGKEVQWSGEAFVKMKNLKMLVIKNAYFSKSPTYLPNSLRWLEWKKYPFRFLPLDFCPIELVYLNLSCSYVEMLQPFDKKFESLREMNFKSCKFLQGIPDLSGASSLTELCVDDCTNIFEIHDSVGYLNKLKRLSAMRCKNLKILPRGLSMASLEHLNLHGCSSVQYFPEILVKMTKMGTLELDRTAIAELPSSICNLIGLEMLNMEECHHLKQLPASIFMLPNLWSLSTNFCTGMRYLKICEDGEEASIDCWNESSKMEYFYFSNCNLSNDSLALCLSYFLNLIQLDLSGGEFTTLPACMEECYYMKYLFLDNCKQLQHILGMPPSLEKFSAINCASLTTISKGRVLDQAVYHKQGKLKYVFPEKEFPEFLDKVSHNPPLSFWICEEFPMILIWILVKDLLDSLFYLNISVLINGDSQEFPSDQWFSISKVNHLYIFDLWSIISKADLKLSQSKRNAWSYVEIFINNSTPGLELVPKIYLGAAVCKQDIKFNNISFLKPEGSKYDVFMNVDRNCNVDTFTRMLCRALYGSKIDVFKRVKDLGWVEDIRPMVIEESRISIIVFSKLYAYHTWCLDTLTMIIDCMRTKGKLVFPIFYLVDPSDVRHQLGWFGLAMDDHESMEKVQKWKLALSEAAHLCGWSITTETDIGDIIPRIVEVVSRHLRLEHLTKSIESTGKTMGHQEQPRDRVELEDGMHWDLNSMKSTDLTESIKSRQGPGHDVLILSFEKAPFDSGIFVDDLYNALYENNINAFKDVGSFGWSEDLDPTALRAIEESRISIIVFSKFYAYSVWCLDALVMILDCMKTKGKLVFPVFYNVDPSMVGRPTGRFELAMAEHENRLKDNMEKVKKWKLALSEAAQLLSWSLEKGEEIDVIPHIVEEVACHLCFELLSKSRESTDEIIIEQPEDREELEDDDPCQDSSSMKYIGLTKSIVSQQGKNKGNFHKNSLDKTNKRKDGQSHNFDGPKPNSKKSICSWFCINHGWRRKRI